MAIKRNEKALRTRPVPPKLGELIGLDNLLPEWIRLPRWDEEEEKRPENVHAFLYRILQWLSESADKLAGENKGKRKRPELDLEDFQGRVARFKQYVLRGFDLKPSWEMHPTPTDEALEYYMDSLYNAFDRYRGFITNRVQLQAIATHMELLALLREGAKIDRPGGWDDDRIGIIGGVRFRLGEGDRMRLEVNELAQALEGVQASRIGRCKVCKRVFWVGRAGMVCCSHACGNVLNNRRYRERYAENKEQINWKKHQAGQRRERRMQSQK